MKFGVRECCDVVLRAKAKQKVGSKIFYANEPVIYFDTLKTSSMEGAATTVYAQGGKGNARLMAWEGERTVTFTMEDALISPEGFMILSGAGLIDSNEQTIYQHVMETLDASQVTADDKGHTLTMELSQIPYLGFSKAEGDTEAKKTAVGNFAYVMLVKNGEIVSEPYIPEHTAGDSKQIVVKLHDCYDVSKADELNYQVDTMFEDKDIFDSVIVDYYVAHKGDGSVQIEITPDQFGGNYYLEASTLFRDQNGVDMPAEFIIPNCKIQSNFTFTMASTGDPSTFTFTMDAFPDYTRFDHSHKVLAAIQIIKDAAGSGSSDVHRAQTNTFQWNADDASSSVNEHKATHDMFVPWYKESTESASTPENGTSGQAEG